MVVEALEVQRKHQEKGSKIKILFQKVQKDKDKGKVTNKISE